MEALEALIGGDAEKCQEILKGLIASAAGGGAPPPAAEPDGDENMAARDPDQPGAPIDDTGKPPPEKPTPAPSAQSVSRVPVEDGVGRRARLAFEADAAELKAILAAHRPAAKETLVVALRARLGSALTPAAEKQIMAAETYQKAKELADFAAVMAPAASQRARSGVEHDPSAPDGAALKAVAASQLAAEGFAPKWIAEYHAAAKRDPIEAQALLDGGRDGLVQLRARKAQNGAAS